MDILSVAVVGEAKSVGIAKFKFVIVCKQAEESERFCRVVFGRKGRDALNWD